MMFPVELFLPSIWLQFTAFIGFIIFAILFKRAKRTNFKKPFASNARRPRGPLECDQKQRALRLKHAFNEKEIPGQIDAIVIGSGAAGLGTAAILAKTGRKVLVLEKHYNAGGACQSFVEHGYEWDVGIHYVGHMGPNDFERFMVDQVTEGQLEWARLDEDFDNVVLAKSPDDVTTIPMWGDRNRLLTELIKRYPKHEQGIRDFFSLMTSNSIGLSLIAFPLLKIIPVWFANFLVRIFGNMFTEFNTISIAAMMDRLFGPGEMDIKNVLGYIFGDYGVEPCRAGAAILLSTYNYYKGGAYYPVGGASEIPYSLIPVVEKAGGRVFVNANVTEILIANNTAIGVRVGTSSGSVDIKAPMVISDAGVSNTFRRLLPKQIALKTKIGQLLESGRIHPGTAMFHVFVGLKGSQDELKLPAKNMWVCYESDLDRGMHGWCNLDMETAISKSKLPFLFIAFPSAKDPSYNQRFPDRSCCTLITFAPIDWFRKWENEPARNRSQDYQNAKMQLANRCWQLALEIFPQLADRKDYINAGSPLSTAHCLNAIAGEPYGLENDMERFSPDICVALRPKVPEIDNLYLTGQDVLACGFVTAIGSALLTCQAIMQPLGECTNLVDDLKQLYNKQRPSKKELCQTGQDKTTNKV